MFPTILDGMVEHGLVLGEGATLSGQIATAQVRPCPRLRMTGGFTAPSFRLDDLLHQYEGLRVRITIEVQPFALPETRNRLE